MVTYVSTATTIDEFRKEIVDEIERRESDLIAISTARKAGYVLNILAARRVELRDLAKFIKSVKLPT